MTQSFPELVKVEPEDVPFSISFSRTEWHGRIWHFDVSDDYTTATTLHTHNVNVYEDVQYAYSIHPTYQHVSPRLHWEGETLYILLYDYAIEVQAYEEYAVYQYADPEQAKAYLRDIPNVSELDVGNRHYFKEKGNLLFTENGGPGTFYVADEQTTTLGELLLSLLIIPLAIYIYVRRKDFAERLK